MGNSCFPRFFVGDPVEKEARFGGQQLEEGKLLDSRSAETAHATRMATQRSVNRDVEGVADPY